MRYIKKYQTELRQQQPWFQDEMRFGTRTLPQRRWTSQGHRPGVEMKYGYSYRYLFQAIQPATGKTFEMYLPNMSGHCFKLFMTEFAKKHPGQTMIMDNAGAHHVKWEDQEFEFPDVKIEYLSPYSPDFNPQERIFQELRKPIKGKIYNSVDQIEEQLNLALKKLWEKPQKVRQITGWNWIL
ncbi:MAG: IS630 family transposase [Bacteroidota bacterium]